MEITRDKDFINCLGNGKSIYELDEEDDEDNEEGEDDDE